MKKLIIAIMALSLCSCASDQYRLQYCVYYSNTQVDTVDIVVTGEPYLSSYRGTNTIATYWGSVITSSSAPMQILKSEKVNTK